MRAKPERIVLGVKAGLEPSPKPPVQIYLGTEPAQYRAERIFVWSIEQVRDPSRVYEIHLMKELAGFDRRMWLTGFTNYRCAIPHFAGGRGRAIWNDVDQVYLTDPAELFDRDLAGHGFLTVPALGPDKRTDSSVMLMDCEQMLRVWSLASAQHRSSKALLRRAIEIPGLHGLLEPEWNARDGEYTEGRSKLIHYTILHTQPWCPIPKRYVYQRNPIGHTWYDLERSADAAGFQVFDRKRQSSRFQSIAAGLNAMPGGTAPALGAGAREISPLELDEVRELSGRCDARRLLEVRLCDAGPDRGLRGQLSKVDVGQIGVFADLPKGGPPDEFDGVVCAEGLEHLPDEDVPWVVEELFTRARRFVYVSIEEPADPRTLPDGRVLESGERGWAWWSPLFEKAGARHPGVNWKLAVCRRGRAGTRTRRQCEGGRPVESPRVWVLKDGSPAHDSQSLGLARALGWRFETRALQSSGSSRLGLPAALRGGSPAGSAESRTGSLAPPWPDVVIASGRRASDVARWIGERSHGQTRVVQLDRRAGRSAELFDIVISNEAGDRPPDPRRIETTAPLMAVDPETLEELVAEGEAVWQGAPRPRVVLLVGGTTARYELRPELARRMATEVRDLAVAAGGAVLALGSSHTSADVLAALRVGLGDCGRVEPAATGGEEAARDETTLAALAVADVVVVTGESQSRLALAAATGKRVYIYPLPARRLSVSTRAREWVEARAHATPLNGRGTVRPQQGLEYLCARLLERGIVLGPRDTKKLRAKLIEQKIAEPFGAPLRLGTCLALREAQEAAPRLRRLLAFVAAT
jgi:mitochondrial fission protein ELM1